MYRRAWPGCSPTTKARATRYARTSSRRSRRRSTPSRTSPTSSSRSSSSTPDPTKELSVVVVIGIALAFDFVNGIHDAANSIATVVSTQVLSPRMAVAWAASSTSSPSWSSPPRSPPRSQGRRRPGGALDRLVVAGLIAAIGWNVLTCYLGLPTSSSGALIGGIAGTAVATGRFDVRSPGGRGRSASSSSSRRLIGHALGMRIMDSPLWVVHLTRNVDRLNRGFRMGQLSRRRPSASATAATTPRRRWE